MIDPIAAAFTVLVLHLHAPADCKPPAVMWSSLYIDSVCQQYALPHNLALSCYQPAKKIIILPDGWDQYNHDHEKLLYHEMDRHIEQACLHHVFTEAEPESVLEAEDLAP